MTGTQNVILPFYSATDTYTTTATGRTYSLYGPMYSFSLYIKGTGAVATSWTVVLEGSYDGTNWDTSNPILTHTNTTPGDAAAITVTNTKPYISYRTRCTALSLGTATNIVTTFTGGVISNAPISTGTVQINPLTATNSISHVGTSGTIAIGTLVGTASIGAGTALYPTNFRIVAISGTPEVILAFGSQTNGNQVIHHGLFPAGGGITSSIPYPHGYGTTNSPLTYQILSGAGTVSWDVDYFLHT